MRKSSIYAEDPGNRKASLMGLVSSIFYGDKSRILGPFGSALRRRSYSSCFFGIQEFNLKRLRLVEDFLFATIFDV